MNTLLTIDGIFLKSLIDSFHNKSISDVEKIDVTECGNLRTIDFKFVDDTNVAVTKVVDNG